MFASHRCPLLTSSKINKTLCCMPRHKVTYGQIGDVNHFLMELSNQEFMQEIRRTRAQFCQKFPEFADHIHEYRKQRMLIDLDIWYEKPVPKRCERFLEMEVYSLLENVEKGTEDERIIFQICNSILREYLPHKYN